MAGFSTGTVQLLVALVELLNKLGHCLHEVVSGRIPSEEFWVQLQLVQRGISSKKYKLGQVFS